jgi:hypothetical protein
MAELIGECIADDVLRLAAAMYFCGFRCVARTTWAMADTDGRDLARVGVLRQREAMDTLPRENGEGTSRRFPESAEKRRYDFGSVA